MVTRINLTLNKREMKLGDKIALSAYVKVLLNKGHSDDEIIQLGIRNGFKKQTVKNYIKAHKK